MLLRYLRRELQFAELAPVIEYRLDDLTRCITNQPAPARAPGIGVILDLALALGPLGQFHRPDAEIIREGIEEINELLPVAMEGAGGAYGSTTRTAFDVSLLNVACVGSTDGGAWQDVRLAIGGTPALARRLRGVEETMAGANVTETSIAEAADAVSAAIDARDDLRASAEYRRELAAVLVRRCLSEVAGRSERRAE